MKKILSIDNKIYSSVTYDTVADLDITGVGGLGLGVGGLRPEGGGHGRGVNPILKSLI